MLIIVLSLLPCIFWLIFFYIQDWYDREPISLVAISFLLGIFSAIPALICNTIGVGIVSMIFGNHVLSYFLQFFFVVGPVEESVKLLAVLIFAYKQPQFDEPVDGIIYSAAAALGFAAIENVLYVSQFSLDVLVVRGPLANAGHALFSAFWGLALSRAKAMPNIGGLRAKIIISGLVAAAFVHGLYDFVLTIMQGIPTYITMIPIALLMIGMFVYVEYKTIGFVVKSPNRLAAKLLRPTLKCTICGNLGQAGDICKQCKAQLPTVDMGEKRYCFYCRASNNPGATVCSSCKASLLSYGNSRPATYRPHFVKIIPGGVEEIVCVLDRPTINIGKTLDNDFVIEDDSVSMRHARILWHPAGVHVVQDLSSINGTFVNGQRVNESPLQNGFEVRFGQLRFVYRAAHWNTTQQPFMPGRMG
jgi:protease PrsW